MSHLKEGGMLHWNKTIEVGGLLVASYGPRMEVDGEVFSTPSDAEFWGVYSHDARGKASFFVHTRTEQEARDTARYLAANGERETIAYLAIGAVAHFERAGHPRRMGQLEAISEVTRYAPVLDTLARGADLDGCFAYEVADPFGTLLARWLRADGKLDPAKVVKAARGAVADACYGDQEAA